MYSVRHGGPGRGSPHLICMVGLPARGKTYIAKKLARYLVGSLTPDNTLHMYSTLRTGAASTPRSLTWASTGGSPPLRTGDTEESKNVYTKSLYLSLTEWWKIGQTSSSSDCQSNQLFFFSLVQKVIYDGDFPSKALT